MMPKFALAIRQQNYAKHIFKQLLKAEVRASVPNCRICAKRLAQLIDIEVPSKSLIDFQIMAEPSLMYTFQEPVEDCVYRLKDKV